MPTIYPLPANLIAKIAAGEVIERPAFVVKELIENSLDAESTEILINVQGSGLKSIKVSDNGHGMSKEDLAESFKLHTTSKIQTIDDLISISSLGFRGEALASIAAVSQLIISSRIKSDSIGTTIEIINGQVSVPHSVGMAVGTVVEVHSLFAKVPARKKFLDNPKSEMRLITEVVSNFILAFPDISFRLTHNNKIALDFNKNVDLKRRISQILGSKTFQSLLPVSYQDNYLMLSGFVSTPSGGAQGLSKQYLFVNSRRVRDKDLSQAWRDMYGRLLEKTANPVGILFLELPFELVDINVHPRKEQVRFINPDHILGALKQAINTSLVSFDLSPKINLPSVMDSYVSDLLRQETETWQVKKPLAISKIYQISQLNNLYLVIQTSDGLTLIDQHAAHERILYQQFLKEFQSQKNQQTKIAGNKVIELSVADSILLNDSVDYFEKLGFNIESFGKNSFKISQLPEIFEDYDLDKLITEALEDLRVNKRIKDVDLQSQKMIAFLSCRAAIMAGEKLTQKEMLDLVQKLEQTDNNSTCPHGRPTKVKLSIKELDRLFKRS